MKKTLYSKPGLRRQAALEGLQKSPLFTPGSVIEDFRRDTYTDSSGKKLHRWAADIKLAEFPPPSNDEEPKDSDSDSGSDDKDPGSEESSAPKPKSDKPDGSPKEDSGSKGGDGEIIALLTQILEALGGSPGEADLGPLGPGGPPPGDLGKPKGPAGPGGPAKPKGTPPGGDDLLPTFASLQKQFETVAGKLPTVIISEPDTGKSIKQAASEINAAGKPYGYSAKTVRREGGKLKVVASVR